MLNLGKISHKTWYVVGPVVTIAAMTDSTLCGIINGVSLTFHGTVGMFHSGALDIPLSWLTGREVCHKPINESRNMKLRRYSLMALSAATAGFGGYLLATTPSPILKLLRAPSLKPKGPYEYERVANDFLEGHAITLRQDDPREKFLWLTAESDWNGALEPTSLPLLQLAHDTDLMFKQINSTSAICHQMDLAVKQGGSLLSGMVVSAHGTPNSMRLGVNDSLDVSNANFLINCGHLLKKGAYITLDSCNTGDEPDGIAAAISRYIPSALVGAPNGSTSAMHFDGSSPPTFMLGGKYLNTELFRSGSHVRSHSFDALSPPQQYALNIFQIEDQKIYFSKKQDASSNPV